MVALNESQSKALTETNAEKLGKLTEEQVAYGREREADE
jgi:hypothetical protein